MCDPTVFHALPVCQTRSCRQRPLVCGPRLGRRWRRRMHRCRWRAVSVTSSAGASGPDPVRSGPTAPGAGCTGTQSLARNPAGPGNPHCWGCEALQPLGKPGWRGLMLGLSISVSRYALKRQKYMTIQRLVRKYLSVIVKDYKKKKKSNSRC